MNENNKCVPPESTTHPFKGTCTTMETIAVRYANLLVSGNCFPY